MLFLRHLLLANRGALTKSISLLRNLSDDASKKDDDSGTIKLRIIKWDDVSTQVMNHPKVIDATNKYKVATTAVNSANEAALTAHTRLVSERTDVVVNLFGEVLQENTGIALTALDQGINDKIQKSGTIISNMESTLNALTLRFKEFQDRTEKRTVRLALACTGLFLATLYLQDLIKKISDPLVTEIKENSKEATLILEMLKQTRVELEKLNKDYQKISKEDLSKINEFSEKIKETKKLLEEYEDKIKTHENLPTNLLLTSSLEASDKLNKLQKTNEKFLEINRIQNLHDQSIPRPWNSWRTYYRGEMDKLRHEIATLNEEPRLPNAISAIVLK